jgi:alcohol dehydrogenase (cytochrome c)
MSHFRANLEIGSAEERHVSDYAPQAFSKTGNFKWRHEGLRGGGLPTMAGNLLFVGDGGGIVAFAPATGEPLWNSRIGGLGAAPGTYMLDGHQYLLGLTGDTLYAFTLY